MKAPSALLFAPIVVVTGGWLRASGAAPSAWKATVAPRQFKLPLYFIENRGQADARVHYYLHGRDAAVYFTSRGMVVALSEAQRGGVRLREARFEEPRPRRGWALRLEFIGARAGVRPEGIERTPAIVSYFKGPRENWKTGLPTYAAVRYRDLWPGIDLVWEGGEGRLKSSFTVRPGADPAKIRLAWRGATRLRLSPRGDLEVETPAGGFPEKKPVAWQQVDGRQVEVRAEYLLRGREYGFEVGNYDRSRELVVDPAVLLYCGYIGGAGVDWAYAIAVDATGNAYLTGMATSSEATFPETVGPDTNYNGGGDAFVAKVNSSGTALVYAGYIGGAEWDYGAGIAVDQAGGAYITGVTSSSETTFPATVGPDTTYNLGLDAFVAKVNSWGTALVYAGYVGGAGNDYGYAITVDPDGYAYLAGATASDQSTFPGSLGPDLTYNGGQTDAFEAKVNANGAGLLYAGYIGGAGDDSAFGIAVDGTRNAYVAGTTSDQATFPATVGPDLTHNGGDYDAFVAKVSSARPTAVFRDTATSIRLLTRYDTPQVFNGAGLFASDPSAAQTVQGNTVAVARGQWGSLWANVFTASSQSWGTWISGGGITQGQPAIAVGGDGKAYIVARDSWNSYWIVPYTPGGSFGTWTYLAGIFSQDPAVAGCPDGSLYIIGRDNWNSLWSGRYIPGSAFQGWQYGGGIIQGKPSVVCGTDNVAYVAVRDNWNSLWVARVQGNSWLGWHWGGGIMSGDPQAVAARDGDRICGVAGPVGRVVVSRLHGRHCGGLVELGDDGGVLQDFGAAGELGEVYIAGRSPSNELWWYRLATNQWTYAGFSGVAAGPPAAAPR